MRRPPSDFGRHEAEAAERLICTDEDAAPAAAGSSASQHHPHHDDSNTNVIRQHGLHRSHDATLLYRQQQQHQQHQTNYVMNGNCRRRTASANDDGDDDEDHDDGDHHFTDQREPHYHTRNNSSGGAGAPRRVDQEGNARFDGVAFAVPMEGFYAKLTPMSRAVYLFIATWKRSCSPLPSLQQQSRRNNQMMLQHQQLNQQHQQQDNAIADHEDSATSHEQVLEHVARLFQITSETWTFQGKMNDSFENITHLAPVEVDALLRFGCFAVSPCRSYVVPNASTVSLVPSVAALCDACERILLVASSSSSPSSSSPSPSPNASTGNSMSPPLTVWCRNANGFGWRGDTNDVAWYCSNVAASVACSRSSNGQQQMMVHQYQQNGSHNHHYHQPSSSLSPDIVILTDAMLSETGAPEIASAMRASLLTAVDRYRSGLAVLIRNSRFQCPRKAAEWHSDELHDTAPTTTTTVAVTSYHAGGSVGIGLNSSSSNSARGGMMIIPCSIDGEAPRQLDIKNPPVLRAQALSVLCDTCGPMVTVCNVQLPRDRVLGYEECSTVGLSFVSYLGLLTCPSAGVDHFVFLSFPLLQNNINNNNATNNNETGHNSQLVRKIWESYLGSGGWEGLQPASWPGAPLPSPPLPPTQQQQQQQQQQQATTARLAVPSTNLHQVVSRPQSSAANPRFSAALNNFRSSQQQQHQQQSSLSSSDSDRQLCSAGGYNSNDSGSAASQRVTAAAAPVDATQWLVFYRSNGVRYDAGVSGGGNSLFRFASRGSFA